MDPKIIDGRALAQKREEALKEKIAKLSVKPKIVSILVGDDAPSVLYTNIKQKKASELGITFEALRFPANTDFKIAAGKIKELNDDKSVNGIMVQLPLPEEFLQSHSEKELLDLITPEKDVDGLTPKGLFLSATAKAVISIFRDEKIPVAGKNVVVVGSSDLVGKPISLELEKLGGLVTICDRQTLNLQGETLEAQILISATGCPGLIKRDMVKKGVIIIDVGAEKVNGKVVGDVDFESVYPKASRITPVPGGVGPMTVISLMENVLESASFQNHHK